jgi:membrane protease YdiL (CAAX protease family)
MNGETMNGDEMSVEPLLPLSGEEPVAAVSELTLELTPEARKLRLLELALVLSVAFLMPTLSSLLHWWTNAHRSYDTGTDSVYRILQDSIALSVLAYVLYRQGRSLRTIGLTARSSDISWTLVVTVCAKLLASSIVTLFFIYHVTLPKAHPPATYGFLKWLAVVPGAALEELIARAYLMTEVAALSGSMALAVIVSVGFQCFYHLYQGVPAVLYHAGTFFAYAVFYAYTRRATPVILAHALANFLILAG